MVFFGLVLQHLHQGLQEQIVALLGVQASDEALEPGNGSVQLILKELMIIMTINLYIYIHLVGGFNPREKYESQLGWWFPYTMGKKRFKAPTSIYIYTYMNLQ